MGRPPIIDNQTILATARTLFTQYGPGLSTHTIAKALGISQATLFKRFSSKENLFFSAMTMVPELPALPDHNDNAKHYLISFITQLLNHVEACSPVVLSLMSHPGFTQYIQKAHQPAVHLAVSQRLMDALTTFQQKNQINSDINPAVVVQHVIEILHGHVLMQLLSGNVLEKSSVETRAETIIGLLWTGLAPKDGTVTLG
jgi:AcrR family transcriptional regulator